MPTVNLSPCLPPSTSSPPARLVWLVMREGKQRRQVAQSLITTRIRRSITYQQNCLEVLPSAEHTDTQQAE